MQDRKQKTKKKNDFLKLCQNIGLAELFLEYKFQVV